MRKERQRLDEIIRMLDTVDRKLDRVDVALIVRDPGTSRSVEAYEGLRKTVVAAVQERTMHLVQLAQLDVALSRTEDVETLRRLVAEWIEQAGMVKFQDPSQPEAFEIVDGRGDQLEVLAPAYIDATNRRVIKQGQARAMEANVTGEAEERQEAHVARPDAAQESVGREAESVAVEQDQADEPGDAQTPAEEEMA